MLSLHKEDILARIAKRAEMRKEISGVLKHVRTIEPEQSWNEYRTLDRARCQLKRASSDPRTLAAAMEKGAQLLTGDASPGVLDRMKTKLFLDQAKYRLLHGDFDVLTDTGLNRVNIPKWGISEPALRLYGFKPSLIAIPERGQESLITYRNPEGHFHLHKHKRRWFMHKDRYPSMNMAVDRIKAMEKAGPMDKAKELGLGAAHVMTEGLPGLYSYLINMAVGAPTFEDIASGKAPQPIVPARVEKKAVVLEVAHTPAERTRGLSGRRTLPDDYGMLFTKAGSFWMKGVPFDLDLLYIDKVGTVVDAMTMRPLRKGEFPEIYSTKSAEASMAVELPGGWCRRNGVAAGSRVTLGDTDGRGQVR